MKDIDLQKGTGGDIRPPKKETLKSISKGGVPIHIRRLEKRKQLSEDRSQLAPLDKLSNRVKEQKPEVSTDIGFEASKAASDLRQPTSKFASNIIKWSIYALIFLIPLFFLPFTAEVLELPKQMILIGLTSIALIGWIGKILAEKTLTLRLSVLDLAVVIFLGIWGAASLLSQNPYGSLVGLGGSIADSFLSVLCFGALYFIIVNNISGKNTEEKNVAKGGLSAKGLLGVFLISATLVIIFGLLQILGFHIFPWRFIGRQAFNTVGTLSTLGIFASLVLSVLALYQGEPDKRRYKNTSKFLYGALAILGLATLILINFWSLWIGIVMLMGFILVFSLAFPKLFENKSLMLVMAVVIIALIFLFYRLPLVNLNLPAEVTLTHKASFGIARETIKEFSLLGSGPNTFSFDYSKWRSPEINNTIFWNIRFNQASSKFISMLATTGILGVLGFFGLVIGFLWMAIKRGVGETSELSKLRFVLLAPWLYLLLATFLYSSNMTLTFFFWLFFAMGAGALLERKRLKLTLTYSPRANQVLTFMSLVLIILIASGLWFEAKRITAQVYFQRAIAANVEGSPAEEVRTLVAKAVNLDPREDSLWRNLSQALLLETSAGINQGKRLQDLQPILANVVSTAKKATELSPQDVANWQARARIYHSLIGLVGGAEDWAESSYKKAIELEPNNPYLHTQLGRVYLMSDDKEKIQEAIKLFAEAIELKRDYSPAHFQISLAYGRIGDLNKAIEQMENVKLLAAGDVGVRFQLGLLYYQKEDFKKAKNEFAVTIQLNPQYSNARYFLGLIYDREGSPEKAIKQFEEIEELNPTNQLVKQILTNLRAGRPALEAAPEKIPIEKEPEPVPPTPGL